MTRWKSGPLQKGSYVKNFNVEDPRVVRERGYAEENLEINDVCLAADARSETCERPNA